MTSEDVADAGAVAARAGSPSMAPDCRPWARPQRARGSLAPAMNRTRLSAVAVALVCASLGAYLAVASRGEARLAAANADLLAGRNAAARAELAGLTGEAGLRAAALRGRAYANSGRLERARRAF